MSSDLAAIFGSNSHVLKLGKSFSRNKEKQTAFHSVRYDFKPASVDNTKEAQLEVGAKGEVNITLPNDQTKGSISCTKFKGSKRPYQKECVLIYDHNTGEFTLEKLTNNIQVKKQRHETSSRPQLTNRPRSTLDPSSAIPTKTSPNRTGSASSKKDTPSLPDLDQDDVSPLQPSPIPPDKPNDDDDGSSSSSYITDSDSDDSKSSDDENDGEVPKGSTSPVHQSAVKPQLKKVKSNSQKPASPCIISQLSRDLQLSESDSDSD